MGRLVAKPATTLKTRGQGSRPVLVVVSGGCPHHTTVHGLMTCPVCSEKLWAHLAAVDSAEVKGNLPPVPVLPSG